MNAIQIKMREVAGQLLSLGEVDRVIGWEKGRFAHQSPPAFITDETKVERLIWDEYCLTGTAKYLLDDPYRAGKTGLFARGCDARAINRLIQDGQVKRENIVIIGICCTGMSDSVSGQMAAKCCDCTHPTPVVYDLMIGEPVKPVSKPERFKAVAELEQKAAQEKSEYWTRQFAKCIRCYACRNICPACNCRECFADQYRVGWLGKQHHTVENQVFGLTRAYHIADRCIECGECARVCPVGIPLMELNRKLIKDIQQLFGDYHAGVDSETTPPLGRYSLDDMEEFM